MVISGNSSDVVFNDDGTKMYISDHLAVYIRTYTLSTAFDVSTAGSLLVYIYHGVMRILII